MTRTPAREVRAQAVTALAHELLGLLAKGRPPPADGIAALLTAAAVLLGTMHRAPDARRAAAARAAAAWIDQVMEGT